MSFAKFMKSIIAMAAFDGEFGIEWLQVLGAIATTRTYE